MSKYLTSRMLAARWKLNPQTLKDWRWKKKGPKVADFPGRVVLYELAEIEKYECKHPKLIRR